MKTKLYTSLIILIILPAIVLSQGIPNWKAYAPEFVFQSGNDCRRHATAKMVEILLNFEFVDLLGKSYSLISDPEKRIDLDQSQLSNDDVDNLLDYIKNYKSVSEPDIYNFLNFSHAYYGISSYNEYTSSTDQEIMNMLANSPVVAGVMIENEYTNPSQTPDHFVVIVGDTTINGTEYWRVIDSLYGEDETYAKGLDGIGQLVHYTAQITTVDKFAKICPTLMSLSDAVSYDFVDSEWAYQKGTYYGSVHGDIAINNSPTVIKGIAGTSPFISAKLTFNTGGWNTKLLDIKVDDKISINNCSPWLENVEFRQNDYPDTYGIYITNGSPSLVDITSTTSKLGASDLASIYLTNSSGPSIDVESIENKKIAVKIGEYSYITTYANFCDNTWDMWAEEDAYDSDIEDVFSEDDEEDCLWYDPDYDLTDYFTINDWSACSGFRKVSTNSIGTKIAPTNMPEFGNELEQGLFIYKTIRRQLIEQGKSTGEVNPILYRDDYDLAIDKFKSYISNSKADKYTLLALKQIERCSYDLGQPESFYSFLTSINNNPKYSVLKPHLLNLFVSYCTHQNQPAQALVFADEILDNYPDVSIVPNVLYGKGLIYCYTLKDREEAAAIFQEFLNKYPNHPTAVCARDELLSMGFAPEMPLTEQMGNLELLVQNYPNPFNPVTEIQFTIPKDGNVVLKIYDIRGRLVTTLIDEYLISGKHSIKWRGTNQNGNPVASGTYFYYLKFGDQIVNHKMMLIR